MAEDTHADIPIGYLQSRRSLQCDARLAFETRHCPCHLGRAGGLGAKRYRALSRVHQSVDGAYELSGTRDPDAFGHVVARVRVARWQCVRGGLERTLHAEFAATPGPVFRQLRVRRKTQSSGSQPLANSTTGSGGAGQRPYARLFRTSLSTRGSPRRLQPGRLAVMARLWRVLRAGFGIALCLSALSCGGGGAFTPPGPGPSPTGNNVVDVIVDQGPLPTTNPTINTLYTSVTVCVPGSAANCQTIDHIQVDTGSYGLRILASVMNAALNLPVQLASNGDSLVECTQFVDGYSWGPVLAADVKIAGETASSVPIQSIGDPRFANVPADCSSG